MITWSSATADFSSVVSICGHVEYLPKYPACNLFTTCEVANDMSHVDLVHLEFCLT